MEAGKSPDFPVSPPISHNSHLICWLFKNIHCDENKELNYQTVANFYEYFIRTYFLIQNDIDK